MSAASWGLVVPVKGSAITSYATPFANLADSVATALDKVQTYAFPRYAKRSDLPTSGNLTRQHATVYADPTTGNNGDYYWNGTTWVQAGIFGQAAGTASVTGTIGVDSSATVDITFPVGRFTQAPIVSVTSTNSRLVAAVSGITTTKATIALGNRSLASVSGGSAQWTAVQMTAASAAG